MEVTVNYFNVMTHYFGKQIKSRNTLKVVECVFGEGWRTSFGPIA
jgi:hypothetical protein